MAKITTNGKALLWGDDQQAVFYGSYRLSITGDYVNLYHGTSVWRLDYKDTTIDEESFDSAKALLNKLSTFSNGGGSGSGAVNSVTGNLVSGTGSDPVISIEGTNKQVVTFDGDGNPISKAIDVPLLTDVGGFPSFANGVLTATAMNPATQTGLLSFVKFSETPETGVFPRYGTGGVLKVANGSANNDAVNLGQLNDRLGDLTLPTPTVTVRGGVLAQVGIPDLPTNAELGDVVDYFNELLFALRASGTILP